MLQKLEADVRQHIRIEQQLKLHIESIQEKMEEDEKQLEKYQAERVCLH
jgi:FtsZ-binding cell division protein ZapB